MEDRISSKKNVSLSNFGFLDKKAREVEELRNLEIYDTADMAAKYMRNLYRDGLGVYEILSCLSEEMHSERTFLLNDSAEITTQIKDRAVFCTATAERLAQLGVEEKDFLYTERRPAEFVYVRNAYSDEAYEVFSQDFDDPRVRYGRDFAECAKLLYSGEVSYCLLPLEEKGGARLPSVAELIYRYDFKICAITPVFGPDNSMDLKYALVSDRFIVPEQNPDDDRYLEIRVPNSESSCLSSLLLTANLFGHSIYRVDTQFLPTEEGQGSFFNVVIRDEGHSFIAMLIYLTVFTEGYTSIGIYKNLE